ncbi:unnamed protein product [Cochlearia groenlandica]
MTTTTISHHAFDCDGDSVVPRHDTGWRYRNFLPPLKLSQLKLTQKHFLLLNVVASIKQSDFAGFKQGWFKKKLRSMSCIAGTTKIQTCGGNKDSFCRLVSRVEVKHCKKQVKAHNGSISVIKFITWNLMIYGYGSHGDCIKALSLKVFGNQKPGSSKLHDGLQVWFGSRH